MFIFSWIKNLLIQKENQQLTFLMSTILGNGVLNIGDLMIYQVSMDNFKKKLEKLIYGSRVHWRTRS